MRPIERRPAWSKVVPSFLGKSFADWSSTLGLLRCSSPALDRQRQALVQTSLSNLAAWSTLFAIDWYIEGLLASAFHVVRR